MKKMSATRSIEILHGLVHGDILSVVVQPLQACTSKVPILKWKRFENQKEILAASVLLQKERIEMPEKKAATQRLVPKKHCKKHENIQNTKIGKKNLYIT